jgi:NADP-dependent 3-hydroxy acid dehydrogenase YdfG
MPNPNSMTPGQPPMNSNPVGTSSLASRKLAHWGLQMTKRCPLDVTPRVVVITGGSSGIGRCTAVLFARHGWRIGLIARGAQGLAACRLDAEAAGAWVATAQADVSDSKALAEAANAIVAALGPIDAWIN